jgi:hypothetical protein
MLFGQGETEFFDYWIGQHLASNSLDFRLSFVSRDSAIECEFKKLSLTHAFETSISHLLERALNSFTLRIEHALLQRNVNISCHTRSLYGSEITPPDSGLPVLGHRSITPACLTGRPILKECPAEAFDVADSWWFRFAAALDVERGAGPVFCGTVQLLRGSTSASMLKIPLPLQTVEPRLTCFPTLEPCLSIERDISPAW